LGLGSTDIVEINGLAPWQGAGPMRVWCEKKGVLNSDDAQEVDEDRAAALEWGHVQEPVIADWYARTRGVQLMLGGHVPNPFNSRMWASLDRKVVGEPRLVEIKNVGSPRLYRHWDASDPDGVPDYVRAQVTIAMGFACADECDVVASVGGRPPHVWRVFLDVDLFRALVDEAEVFLRMLAADSPPSLDHTPASKTYLRARYPRNVEHTIVQADANMDCVGMARARAAADEAAAAKVKAHHDAILMSAIGDADGVEGTGWRMTWKCDKTGVRRSRFTSLES
jgi:predicted phage-related endonuclease